MLKYYRHTLNECLDAPEPDPICQSEDNGNGCDLHSEVPEFHLPDLHVTTNVESTAGVSSSSKVYRSIDDYNQSSHNSKDSSKY
jgi:hypothetical protein